MLGFVLDEFLPRFPFQIWVSEVTFVTFSGDRKSDALHLSHFWEECDALAHEDIVFKGGPEPSKKIIQKVLFPIGRFHF